MSTKILKMLLMLFVIVLANMYWGCMQTYPKEKMSPEEQMRLKQLEINQQILMQQRADENKKIIEELRKEMEELKKKQ